MRILILCTGNSSRSQMAHGFLQSFDRALTVRSAGTEPARRVHPLAVKVMAEAGIDISTHVPQHVDAFLQQPWDYVVTVCGRANATCPAFTGSVRLNLDYVDLVYPQQPVGDIKAAWRNLETAVRQGKVRTLGLSNFEVPGAEDWPSPVSPTVTRKSDR